MSITASRIPAFFFGPKFALIIFSQQNNLPQRRANRVLQLHDRNRGVVFANQCFQAADLLNNSTKNLCGRIKPVFDSSAHFTLINKISNYFGRRF